MKAESAADLSIGGAELAAHAIKAGLVDEFRTVVAPVILGGGKPWLPDGVRVDLELVDERRFRSGAVYLAYARR
jgi:dihydrofolate reductase